MNLTAPQKSRLKVLIVDDHLAIQQDLEYFFQQQSDFIVVGACGTVHEAKELINATKPDLLLLDIGLPDGTGFDILDYKPTQAKVIFMTAYNDNASLALRYSAIDYLLKPINENELREALQKVIKAHPLLREQIDIAQDSFRKRKKPDCIVLQSGQFEEITEVKDICYIQGEHGSTVVFLNGGKKVVTPKCLKYYEELLPAELFLRTHYSYLVNKFYIQRKHRKKDILSLKDGTEIPVSLRKKEMINLHFKTL
ncbi:hypothetical protein A4D02_13785 [Niastella koreensis]|uniref:Two component transcriptional regulator, LytTR family n=2 Tax=Niastella koreensis TaxID=354356 RepID=G8TQ23_NIAKG|nr:LytTR family DNA-binding domain-containing protein [Niastella koreensis]AEW01024.1 two component transcriptional regulator, LytTR family [Niastella koreensis GR20-10]OQP42630.1 hypothetical protein A4D02_13785 [Niastella koreensis]